MRSAILALCFLAAAATAALAASPAFTAGVLRLSVPDVVPFSAFVFYPSQAPATEWQAGPFPVHASPGVPIAPGKRFPVVLFSHGGGPGGGNPLLHRDLASALARNGFIVVTPIHGNTAQRLMIRPLQVREALEATLADPRFAAHADPARLGMIGYSLGGAVALIVAGAQPDYRHLAAYCRDHSEDIGACRTVRGTDPPPAEPLRIRPRRLSALVLLDPLAALFDEAGLADVQVPILLYRPEQADVLREPGNADALAAALPARPALRSVPGGHFVFVDQCPASIVGEVECADPPGVDRNRIHRQLEEEIVAFLRANL